jgi:hypothetical protein
MNFRLLLTIILSLFVALQLSAQCVSNTEWTQIVPSTTMPTEIERRHANNNLDLMEFEGRYYVGIRNAPSHFASKKARMYLVSTTDFTTWKLEQSINLQTDVREPRFYQRNDTLFFTYFKLGTNRFKFEPQGIYQMHYTKGSWSAAKELDIPYGYVPWRVKVHEGLLYMSSYEGLYEYQLDIPCPTRIFVSHDAYNWKPISEAPQIMHPRASAEGEFVFVPNGDLWGISRLEFDGSYIVHAKRDSIDKWEKWWSPHKFDSPLMFIHNGLIILIARRNLDGDGKFYRKEGKYKKNLVRYSLHKKTTAVYVMDTLNKTLLHITDLKSTGDCAFAGVARIDNNTYHLLNYSSNINKRKKSWIMGQLGRTYIYHTQLTIGDCKLEDLKPLHIYPFVKSEVH